MKRETKIRGYIIRSAAVGVVFSCAIVGFASAFSLPGRWLGLSSRSDLPIRPAALATQTKTLTFADRVAYQRAIEEIYWRHRMWPKENTGPKPSLDKVLSQAQIEKKVEDYLLNSQLLADYWQQPITPEQLQSEMERMAKHTKQPEVLRELFAALGNDPMVIAECLARPILSERLVTSLYAYDQRFHGELQRRAEAELAAHRSVSQMKQTSGTYSEAELVRSDSANSVGAGVSPAQPTRLPPQKPTEAKSVATAKLNSRDWDENVQKLAAKFGDGNAAAAGVPPAQPTRLPRQKADLAGTRAPITQIKTGVLSSLQEDEGHYYATAVISKAKDHLRLATIAWMKEPFDSWRAEAETHMPRTMAVAITAEYTLPTIASPSGGCTDDTWTSTSLTNVPAVRFGHVAVWTGSEMIVWGGYDGVYLNTGGRYNPSTDSWTATSTGSNAPTARAAQTAVWTGSEMIVWGGFDGGAWLNTGRRYNPGTDSWTATTTTNAPTGRTVHTAVWTGSEMIVWGGGYSTGSNFTYLNTGGRYNPGTDSWTATSTANAPAARAYQTAVWTSSEMIVWGGCNGNPSCTNVLNTGQRYNPSTNSWTATSTTNAPAARASHTGAWTGSEMIVWGGFNGTIDVSSGARYNPTTDTWTATSTTSTVDARELHTAVWTGSEMIVWGGVNNGAILNTGGRYSPSTDSWIATSVTNAPDARGFQTAVWTGNEMIVWGGESGTEYFNTGGRYCAQSGSTHPAFFSGEVSLGNGVYYLQFPNGTPFGYYSYLTDQNFIYHFDMGFEYLFNANDGQSGIYFYDFMSNHFFYTSPSFPFPYLYDFSLNSVLYYYPDTSNPGHYTTNPRYFYNFATGQIITM